MNTLITNPAVASGAVTIISASSTAPRTMTTEEILDRFSMNVFEHNILD